MERVIVIGAGGHAKVVINALISGGNVDIIGITDSDEQKWGTDLLHVPIIGGDSEIDNYSAKDIKLVNGVGTVGSAAKRRSVFDAFRKRGFDFMNVLHPSAVVAADVRRGQGVQIMAGAVIQPGCEIGNNTIVNTGSIIDHDSRLSDHVHIAPGVVLSGNVTVGEAAHIGTGASIIHGICIGKESLVAAGATVVGDVPEYVLVAGVPARKIDR